MTRRQKILLVFGTRPEAIKLAPVSLALSQSGDFEVETCVTAQHRELLDQVLEIFEIKPDFDLNVMKANQSLSDLSANLMREMKGVLEQSRPDWVIVQGDTTTALIAALAAFYQKIPVAHVEAGLRTHDRYSPFPEEMNRKLISSLAEIHFAPTEKSRLHLLAEGISDRAIMVTGNTVIDALLIARDRLRNKPTSLNFSTDPKRKLILLTLHRRESFGEGLRNVCRAVRELSLRDDVEVVFPVHPNPNVRAAVAETLANLSHVHLVDPLDYMAFVQTLERCYFVITDSGGIQEEAPGLAKPVLVVREHTERTEGIESGNALLVGTDKTKIIQSAIRWLDDPMAYKKAAQVRNPYGDGTAAAQVAHRLRQDRPST